MRLLRTTVAVAAALIALAAGAQQQVISTGSGPGSGTGDPGYTAFTKVNSNFTQLFNAVYPMPSGILYGNGTSLSAAGVGNLIALFGGTCNSTTFLRADGSCQPTVSLPVISPTASFSATGCSNTTLVGGANSTALLAAGSFNAGASGTCTVVLTLPTATHGWACHANDITSAIVFTQTATTTASCTVSSAAVSGDTITFLAVGY